LKHVNPYRIKDPNNWLEVTENSSHHELDDAKRVWKFRAYSFTSATEVEKFFRDEGLILKDYVGEPKAHREYNKNLIIINIVPKSESRNHRALRSIEA